MIGRNNLVKFIDCCYREPLMKFRIMKEKGFSLYIQRAIAIRLYSARIGNVNFERVEF